MNNKTVLALATLALAAPLSAQDTVRPIHLLMPADSSLVVHVKGPVGTMHLLGIDSSPFVVSQRADGEKH